MSDQFSYYNSYKGIREIIPTCSINIIECAEIIKSKELEQLTNKIRVATDPKIRKDLKMKLPYATFSGVFSSRTNDTLIERSHYFCIDLDHVGKIIDISKTEKLIFDHYNPALSFISPSGSGIKIIFKIDIEAGTHLEYFTALKNFIKKKTERDIDEQCKDVSRACFLCHDSYVISKTPDTLGEEFLIEYLQKSELINDKASIITTSASNSLENNEEASRYKAARKHTDSKLSFIRGQRNKYIVTLADTCNRFGIPKQYLMSQIGKYVQDDFSLNEIQSAVSSRYNHFEWHGLATNQNLENGNCPYVRVGTDYYKVIQKTNRWNIVNIEYKRWTKDALITDYGKKYLRGIPKYNDFCMTPDNMNYKQIINNQVNLYSPPCHTPVPGEWPVTKMFLEHIFGTQYEQGLRYMQILYCYPQQSTIILALVSCQQKTGKTTFVNWISMIFGNNSAVISSSDFQSTFNGHYATKNIVMIEETLFDKKLTIEKLKALATQKQVLINRKNIDHFNLEYFGKIILTSNHEDRFAQISKEETRFFVRKLGAPKYKSMKIEKELLLEIPAFLNYLANLPQIDMNIDRSGFSSEELRNDFLDAVKQESQHEISKELRILLTEFFDNHENLSEFYASAIDIKTKFFANDNRIRSALVGRVLKEDFGMQSGKSQRYFPFGDNLADNKTGRPFRFLRSSFQNGTI
ncbi:MAG: hypothetical protein GXY51_04090 [Bacteroidetes bacterium]|nr:hypothetical protein [Bacteroidota bacterium]